MGLQKDKVVGKRILLADDQQGVREAVRFLLQVDAHTVTEAKDGQEALDLFNSNPFDLVITDYSMPRMSGDELAANIRQRTPAQPILMITAYASDFSVSPHAVSAVLHKPFSFDDLRQAITNVLRQEGGSDPIE